MPDSVKAGEIIQVTGYGFNKQDTSARASINEIQQQFKFLTDSTAVVTITPGTISGFLKVVNRGKEYFSP